MGSVLSPLTEMFEKHYTLEDEVLMYRSSNPSFIDQLNFKRYDHANKNFFLNDNVSKALVLTFKPLSTEGATPQRLAQFRNAIEKMYKVFDTKTEGEGQWVVQEFNYNDNRIGPIIDRMRAHQANHARGTQYSEFYLRLQEHHLKGLSKEGGIFKDKAVTNENWGFRAPRTKMVIYRHLSKKNLKDMERGRFDPNQELEDLLENIEVKLQSVGIEVERDTQEDTLYWLYKFFNPNPNVKGDKEEHYQRMAKVDTEGLLEPDLRELVLSNQPVSDTKRNCWWLDGRPMRFLRFDGLNYAPRIGQITGEVISGEGANATVSCAMDSIPDGCMVSKTTVFVPASEFEEAVARYEDKSTGQTPECKAARKRLEAIEEHISFGHRIVRSSLGIYVSGKTLKELDSNQRKVISTFNNNNIELLDDQDDGYSMDAFLKHLPMSFNPQDKQLPFLRLMLEQHAANLSFMFGRAEGSGNPNLFYFNRGGAPILHDPMNKFERSNNAFGIILGPPGAGKSVKMTTMTMAIMATYRPRMFMIEYGNSFGLLGDLFAEQGLTVNKIKLDKENAPSLAPFADIGLILDETTPEEMKEAVKLAIVEDDTYRVNFAKKKKSKDYETDSPDDIAILMKDLSSSEKSRDLDDNINDNRDVLGELELIALLMITGGEEAEYKRYSRADKYLLKEGLIRTAIVQTQGGHPELTITSDVIDTFERMADGKFSDTNYTPDEVKTIRDMSKNLKRFTIGFDGLLFNRPGKAWEDTDVTIVDLAALSSDGNKDKLAIAYISLMQRINNIAETTQHEERQIVVFTDECHLVLWDPHEFHHKSSNCIVSFDNWLYT